MKKKGRGVLYEQTLKFKTLTNFCSIKKPVQATRFFSSRQIFPASPSNTYFFTDSVVPHNHVFSLASSRKPNNNWEDMGKLEGLD